MCGYPKASALVLSVLFFVSYATPASKSSDAAIYWNSATLQGIRDAKLGAPVVARALAIVHTCMYDAWAAYDERAVGTQLGGALRRPASERTLANKEQAISHAAYRALVDVLPVDTNSVYIPLMKQLGCSSKIEPGVTPAHPVTLRWQTFTEAANEAGISRRYGGIHFRAADLTGRLLGRIVAFKAWQRAKVISMVPPNKFSRLTP